MIERVTAMLREWITGQLDHPPCPIPIPEVTARTEEIARSLQASKDRTIKVHERVRALQIEADVIGRDHSSPDTMERC